MGNWDRFWQDNSDSGATWDINQTRTHNAANEIESITDWITPDYDARGNMISGPKPGAETTRIHMKYDAWNRMVAVYADDDGEEGDLIMTARYDGLNRRIRKFTDENRDSHLFRG